MKNPKSDLPITEQIKLFEDFIKECNDMTIKHPNDRKIIEATNRTTDLIEEIIIKLRAELIINESNPEP